MSNEATDLRKRSALDRIVGGIETVGNKLPHPFWLFVIFMLITIFLSFLLNKAGVAVTYMAAQRGGVPVETTVGVVNLLSYDAMRGIFTNFVKTYVNFAPLGLVVTMMLGIGIMEQAGMVSALMRKSVLGAPSFLVTTVLALVGINANLASDAGIIFTPVIGAAVFKALGKNPWVGIITGYAAANGGFTANFLIAGTDALLAGITESAAQGMNIPGPTHPAINWYFTFFSTLTLAIATVFVTEKFTTKYLGDSGFVQDQDELKKHQVTPEENKGLMFALVATIAYIAVILLLTVPEGSLFRNPETGKILPSSPLMSSIMMLLFAFFFVVGIAYGVGSGVIKKSADVPKLMTKGLQGSVGFMVVVLPASLFIQCFSLSKLDVILSVNGASWLNAIGLSGVPLLIGFVLLVTILNLFMMSGSAKWLILAPIFVPMLYQFDMPPALVQAAYRVGDSSTNPLSPVSYYLPVIIGLMEQYKTEGQPEPGIGTVISLTLPYGIVYLVVFLTQLIIWYLLGLPLGPGTPIHI